ncbi:hypothetical protein AMELA_G00057510 [Ameiurus melas]|uniref:Uncharacterized protein n=1 Tax=Ameiurus melas TaxID=219545 RepID=A0A7J6B4N1_AMEME|nr:hypothetical protein AMELA_G00057510 [Ameiurus melas]
MQHLCLTLCGLLASCLCCWGSSYAFSVITQDIPRLITVNGTGTNFTYERENETLTSTTKCGTSTAQTITAPQNTSQQPVTTLLVSSLSSAVVILSICVCLGVWRVKRGCKQSERMVIREGPPSEGTEPENSEDGGSSRTSRGSTQWYMVPVYESYFDLQRSDKEECADSDNTACASALK